jgi:hypothetical protein
MLGFAGPKEEAEEIKRQIGTFLNDTLKLELSEQKTLITHGRTSAARFLGYDVVVLQEDRYRAQGDGRRTINGKVSLSVPREVATEWGNRYMKGGKPVHRNQVLSDSDLSIIDQFQAEFRGLANYYQLAYNRSGRLKNVYWIMETSLIKTLARKYKTSVRKIRRKYGTRVETPIGMRTVLQVSVKREGKPPRVAIWGMYTLTRPTVSPATISEYYPDLVWAGRNDLIKRVLADTCELCGSRVSVEVHHIKKLADLDKQGNNPPSWVRKMAARRRKTLVVCKQCHLDIHAGRPTRIAN